VWQRGIRQLFSLTIPRAMATALRQPATVLVPGLYLFCSVHFGGLVTAPASIETAWTTMNFLGPIHPEYKNRNTKTLSNPIFRE
jgi:hypothetical protein